MQGIVNTLVKAPLDKVGASIMRQISSPVGAIAAGTAGAFTGIITADAISRRGLFSVDGMLNVGLNVVAGVAMLGVGAAYGKPYFTSMGKITLGVTAAGVAVGLLAQNLRIVPEIQLKVDFAA